MAEHQPSVEPELHRAARLGRTDDIRRLIAAGWDINARFDLTVRGSDVLRGFTPLMLAAASVDGATVETLQFLVENGADPLLHDGLGATGAWYAAGSGTGNAWHFDRSMISPDNAERLRFLLDRGLDPGETLSNGRSLLTEAAVVGDPLRVALLLERGVSPQPAFTADPDDDVDAGQEATEEPQFYSFASPLFCAAESGSGACVQMLLSAGADPNQRDSWGRTALMHAASADVARALIAAGARLDIWDRREREDVLGNLLDGDTSMSGGPADQRMEAANVVLDAGASLEAIDGSGWTRLYRKAFRREADAVDFLLRNRAKNAYGESEPIAPGWKNGTPLHAVCWQGDGSAPENLASDRIVRALVAAGVAIEVRDDEGRTALHKAVGGDWGNTAAVRALLALGAPTNALDFFGQTALHIAVRKGELECVRLLLSSDAAGTLLADAEGLTPIDHARQLVQLCEWRVAQSERILPEMDDEALREAHEIHAALIEAAARSQGSGYG